MTAGPCVTGPSFSVRLIPPLYDQAVGREECVLCGHDAHRTRSCMACRTDARLTRLEAALGLPSPQTDYEAIDPDAHPMRREL